MDYIFDKNDIFAINSILNYKMKKQIQNKLKYYDITLEQWYILYYIHQNEGCNQKRLAEATNRDTGSMTRSLNTLENKGLIERKNSYQDKREFLIYLTDRSKDLYKKTSVLMSQNAQEIKSIFTESELKQFMYLLKKLDSNLE